ncbi:unnamed protein product [Adineta steineri]|uniref:Uncharacterized protein n=1 Tax=Adineta steineri TaxID=433720 RepID=A0A815I7L9_9BILA|nr:unnamed protein product [Adineta steineri]CAF3666574.1 unnamed protein product [Adineta steineri]
MARLIRRQSMERLELYDLDKLLAIPSINFDLSPPPPIPPPRKSHPRRASMNPTFERYQFLCNMTRNKTDPIYAATPMFTTIPQLYQEKTHRQLLGSYVRLENVKPLSPKIIVSPEPKSAEILEEEKENEGNRDDDDDGDAMAMEKNDNDGDGNQFSGSSSSSSSEQEEDDGNYLDDDDDQKGVVEQIFNRHKKE